MNHQIKKATTDKEGNINTALNLTAHALWGAVEAYAGNRHIASGAVGAVSGEAAANLIAETLYGKSPNQLNQEEKTTVSTLSQVAAGIAGGTLANSSDGAIIAAKIAKEVVENNTFGVSYTQWKKEEKLREENLKAYEKIKEEQLKIFADALGIVADFTPLVGDMKSFAEAEDSIDYTLAVIGVIPCSEIVTKPLKAAKESIQKAKAAEKLGNVAEVTKYQQEAVKQIRYVKELEVDSYKNLRVRSKVGDDLDLDHIPSFGALKKAKENELGRKLSPLEEKRLRDEATAIAVPKDVHINSRTYGGRNTKSQILEDADDLCSAQKCDINKMRNSLIEKGYNSSSVEDAINKIIIRNNEKGIK